MEKEVMDMMSPAIQYGFGGFSFLLMALIFWMIRKLIDVITMNSGVISTNTKTIETLLNQSGEELNLLRAIHDKLISRPCMKEK